ncbi:MAG: Mov34/MPN/PAD-1 family protein [Candidatus Bathyarchaeia archaeon]
MNAGFMISINKELLEAILEGARRLYPKETILLLRGRKNKNSIEISDLLIPPLAKYGRGFASLPLHMLPMDFSIVGTAHSHPSGNLMPSHTDLNHFFGVVLMITAFPFRNKEYVVVYNRSGEKVTLHVTEA